MKKHSNAPKEGYCMAKTKGRLVYVLLALLFLFISLCTGAFGLSLWGEDKALWDSMDYLSLMVAVIASIGFAAAGIYEGYTSIRDAFFPEKSRLAVSIRSQLSHPDMAPPVKELFAMVDKDIRENGQWFESVAVGKEWVLGDDASHISRIRAVFGRNELQRVHSQNRVQTRRIVQLLIVDDRKQVQITGLQDPRKLEELLSCLRQKAPAALFLPYSEYMGFCGKTDEEWASMERAFRQGQQKIQDKEAVH